MENEPETEEAEEVLLFLEFADFDETSVLTESKSITLQNLEHFEVTCSVVGSTGVLAFAGEHQTNLGTCHFYQSVKRSRDDGGSGSGSSGSGEGLQYLGQTTKKTKFRLKHFSSSQPTAPPPVSVAPE
jgi:hypothetical protein